jgi:hypothetical protein
MLASPRFRKKKSYLEDVGRRNSDAKERLERRDLIKHKLHADHMIGDDDDDDYLTKQLQLASSHFQPTDSTVSRRVSGSSSRGDSRRESTSSVNSARSHSDALTRQLQLASSHFQPTNSTVSRRVSGSSSRRDSRRESASSVNSARSHSDALNRKIDGILSAPYIENRRKHRSESIEPIARSVTTMRKTATSRRHSSKKDDGTESSPPITTPNDRSRRRFSLPSSSRSRSQNAVRDKKVEVPSPPLFPPATMPVSKTTRRKSGPLSPQLLIRKTTRTPRTNSSSRNHSLSRSLHSADTSSSRLSRRMSPHSVTHSISRQPDTIGTSMSSSSAHLSQKSYISDSDDDDDESILSSIFRTVGEVYDECL